MTKIIAFTGPACAGKDLTAEIMATQMLKRDPNVRIRTLSFAAPIKEAVAAILGCQVHDFEDRTFKEGSLLDSHRLDTSPRQMMQKLGDDYARQMIDADIWLKIAHTRYETCVRDGADFLFITDCRYDNEAEWVLENEGHILYIDRPDVAPVSAHVSEAGLSRPPCFVVDNRGSIDDLRLATMEMTCLLQRVSMERVSIDSCSPAEWDRLRA